MSMQVLFVDDHYLMIEGYKSILAISPIDRDTEIYAAHNCEEAFNLITKQPKIYFEMVFLDLTIPPFPNENLWSGADLAKVVKKHLPECKITILTSHAEAFVLYDIIKEINPSGLLVKSDITIPEFRVAFEEILNGTIYYSATVKQYLREITSRTIYLDNYNRQIILLMAQGIKTKNLPNHLPLSISAIDKRKVLIKEYFNLDRGTDEDILYAAKKAGFI